MGEFASRKLDERTKIDLNEQHRAIKTAVISINPKLMNEVYHFVFTSPMRIIATKPQ